MATKPQENAVIDETLAARRRRLAARARAAKGKKIKAVRPVKQEKSRPSGTIRPGEMYTLFGLEDLFGIGKATIRKAQIEGLEAVKIGSRKMFRGEDLIRHFAKKKPK